jgi:hypothetical protein
MYSRLSYKPVVLRRRETLVSDSEGRTQIVGIWEQDILRRTFQQKEETYRGEWGWDVKDLRSLNSYPAGGINACPRLCFPARWVHETGSSKMHNKFHIWDLVLQWNRPEGQEKKGWVSLWRWGGGGWWSQSFSVLSNIVTVIKSRKVRCNRSGGKLKICQKNLKEGNTWEAERVNMRIILKHDLEKQGPFTW